MEEQAIYTNLQKYCLRVLYLAPSCKRLPGTSHSTLEGESKSAAFVLLFRLSHSLTLKNSDIPLSTVIISCRLL
jgi:hypothetical protein